MNWFKEFLKDYVAEDKIEEVVNSFKKEFPKHAVPKSDFNEIKEELKTTKGNLDETKTLIDGLKQEASSVEDYKKQINELNDTLKANEEQFNKNISEIKKKTAYKELLVDVNFNKSAIDLLVATADYNNIQLDENGIIKDKDSIINNLKETRGDLINQVTQESNIKTEQHTNNQTKSIGDMSTEEYYASIDMKPFNKRR